MWNLPVPLCSAAVAYETCTQGIRDASLKRRFDCAKPDVERADRAYQAAGQSAGFGTLSSSEFMLPDLSVQEVVSLYDRRMADKRSAGRAIYDSIRVASRGGKCPLCGYREVMTLDHYLPKSRYTALAVNPVNLIPACSDCNKLKSSGASPVLHPYYDNIEGEPWLHAEVLQLTPVAVRFFVECPTSWPQVLADRVSNHFRVFRIDDLYGSQAARRMRGDRRAIGELFDKGGKTLVHEYLENQARSWESYELNSWEAVLYTALANSDWFCSGGFD